MKNVWAFGVVLIGLLLIACGGGSSVRPGKARAATAVFTVHWPAPGRFIHDRATLVKMVVSKGEGFATVAGSDQVPRPSAGETSQIKISDIPSDESLRIDVWSEDVAGVRLSSAVLNDQRLKPGSNALTFTLNSVVTSIEVTPTSPTVAAGGVLQLSAVGKNGMATVLSETNDFIWSSSNPQVASVDNFGKVVGIKNGVATIAVRESGNDTTGRVSTTQVRVGTSSGSGLAETSWPVARGDALNSGRGPGTVRSGHARWMVGNLDAAFGSPVIGANQTLYVATRDRYLHAYDLATGVEKWKTIFSDIISTSVAADRLGTVYLSTSTKFCAIDGATGEIKWSRNLSSCGSPTINSEGNICVISNGDQSLHLLSPEDGTDRWVAALNATSNSISPPAIAKDGSILVAHGGFVNSINPVTRVRNWTFNSGSVYVRGITVTREGRVYFGTSDGLFCCLDIDSGAQKWAISKDNCSMSMPCVGNNERVYFSARSKDFPFDSQLFSVSAETGQEIWRFAARDVESSPIIASDGTLYCGGGYNNQTLYAINGNTGEIKWNMPLNGGGTGGYRLSLGSDGTVYAASGEDGYLYAIE